METQAVSLAEIQTKDWITTRELALLLDKTLPAARRWAWSRGVNRSPSDYSLLSRNSIDIILRNGSR